jgi:hypothetical protein
VAQADEPVLHHAAVEIDPHASPREAQQMLACDTD